MVAKHRRKSASAKPRARARTVVRDGFQSTLATDVHSDTSATRAVANALRREILRRPNGERFIGREDELVAQFKVSKPTFRQAAKMLEHEQILVIKRGARGGFFSRAPTEKMVSHMAAMVLTTRGATLKQIAEAAGPLTLEAVRQVASNPDASVRAKVAEFVESNAGFEKLPDYRDRGRVLANFETLLAQLCGNPAIALFSEAIRALIREPGYSVFRITPEQAALVAEHHRSLARLIAQGEAEMAVILARRYAAMVAGWLPDSPARVLGEPARG